MQPAVSALHTHMTLLAHNHDKQDKDLVQSLTMIGSHSDDVKYVCTIHEHHLASTDTNETNKSTSVTLANGAPPPHRRLLESCRSRQAHLIHSRNRRQQHQQTHSKYDDAAPLEHPH